MARNREITRNYLLGLKQAEESHVAMAVINMADQLLFDNQIHGANNRELFVSEIGGNNVANA